MICNRAVSRPVQALTCFETMELHSAWRLWRCTCRRGCASIRLRYRSVVMDTLVVYRAITASHHVKHVSFFNGLNASFDASDCT